ncbi:hypothetical protein HII31_11038 [Pseudocercospora fuligena]|uniref:Uncharacterized protein n=1 Tax=Pseudocercospora fuligena TaxID=685502 RepID=A0A8H6RB49_9PEZI|nr:hypothetical protein HII31_11038 [Pseudocercospora fuligena]
MSGKVPKNGYTRSKTEVNNAMSFQEFQDQPGTITNSFPVLRVNSNDWFQKLGFILPDQYSDPDLIMELDTPIDKFADLTKIMRDTNHAAAMMKRREQWIWLTEFGWPFYSEWDKAFVTATRYAQGDRKLNKTSMYVAECQHNAGFICNVWSTRAPALIHFIVEDDPVDLTEFEEEGLSYSASPRALRQVTARIIEFPLKDAYLNLSANTFPSQEEQVLGIMTGDKLYEQFEPYHYMEQMMKRFNEVMQKVGDKRGELLWYVWEADRWMIENVNKPLGLEDAMTFVHDLSFILTGNMFQVLVLDPLRTAKSLLDEFTGNPKRGDWVMGDSWQEPEEQILMGDFMKGDWMKDLIASLSSKSVMESVTASAGGSYSTAQTAS